ncbi:MAG: DUF4252 domain-containing protein [Algibacter sp.]|uniref:DUF4252 domain-containing protein n=1 Tax=Algibacter sp. TaxID=1872428 RepID=UPI002635008A|nr:DUF4252 domain-containing protein [Algibacter sp.]MDG1728639.1 DUF4252 domain-containing protein [Algibacter sp.]MDG2179624.1 DUF4252 domain-containing protein [Algibacter sp.]
MQRTIKYLAYTLLIAVIFTSCGDNVSLQRYYVDNQESKNFISQDFPLSLIEIDKSNFTEAQEEAYNSVDKLNFLGYKASETDTEFYKAEVAKVKTILSDSKYNDLMEFSDKGNKIYVKYIGTDDEADEVVVFGSAKDMGFGIVRILGDDMNPEKMVTLISAMQDANIGEGQIENIMNFFK